MLILLFSGEIFKTTLQNLKAFVFLRNCPNFFFSSVMYDKVYITKMLLVLDIINLFLG